MRLSLNIIYDRLEISEKNMASHPLNQAMVYQGLMLYKDEIAYDAELLREYLLLGLSGDFPASMEGCGILSVGRLPDALREKNACVEFDQDCDLYQIFYRVQSLFCQFGRWERLLAEHLDREDFMDVVCRSAAKFFGNPVIFHDNGQVLYAWSDLSGLTDIWIYNKEIEKYSLSTSLLNQFKVSREYQASMLTDSTELYSDSNLDFPVLYCNFFVAGQFMGRYCVSEISRKIQPGDYQILDYINRITQQAYRYGRICLVNQVKEIETLLIDAIEGKPDEGNRLGSQMKLFQWLPEDRYLCVVILLNGRDVHTYAVIGARLDLERMFPGDFVFVYGKNLVLLANLDRRHQEAKDISSSLAYFLREGIFKAGISRTKHGYDFLKDAFWEASEALVVGNYMDPTKWYYYFEQYRNDYICMKSMGVLSAGSLCHPGVLLLQEYDKRHKTQLFKTLQVYLNCDRNLAGTSRQLFIHRSTLEYRLEKIRKITGADLEQPKIRFQMLESFRFLEWESFRRGTI